MPDPSVIMGVDPAVLSAGVGIIRAVPDGWELIHTDLIRTNPREKLPQRLQTIFQTISAKIREFQPDLLALEDIFYYKNLRIAMSLGQARGMVMLACALNGIELAEYTAKEIKQAVTGNGAASKEQVAFMVKSLLNITQEFDTYDLSDSLACALCAGFKLSGAAVRE